MTPLPTAALLAELRGRTHGVAWIDNRPALDVVLDALVLAAREVWAWSRALAAEPDPKGPGAGDG